MNTTQCQVVKQFASSSLVGEDLEDHERKFGLHLDGLATIAPGGVVDAHAIRASYEFGIPVSEVTAGQRTAAKTLNYVRAYTVRTTDLCLGGSSGVVRESGSSIQR